MDIENIWAQFGQQLKKFIAARVSEPHVAEELTQELLIRIYQSLESIKDKDRIDAWLYRIARNVINDHYRKMKRNKEDRLAEMDKLVVLLEESSLHDVAHEELSRCIQPFVDQLPEKYRRTLTAVDLIGISQKALAEQLGVSHSTIKSQTQRARVQLKQLFNRCCDFTIDVRGNLVGYNSRPGNSGCQCDCD